MKLGLLEIQRVELESGTLIAVGYFPESSSARMRSPARVLVWAIRLTMTS